MSKSVDLEQKFEHLDDYMPSISLDCVLIGYKDEALQVLLLKWKNAEAWALPGGFLKKEEQMEEAADRVLFERTGLRNIFLAQFHTFSTLNRDWDKDDFNKKTFDQVFGSLPGQLRGKVRDWFSQRFVTTGFLALVEANQVKPTPDLFSEKCEWVPIEQLPPLTLDHRQIIEKALELLKNQLNYLPIGQSLLPEKFTMKELQSLYEAILQKPLDRGNFQRKMRALNFLKRHEKLMTGAANKAPYLYSFNEEVYFKSIKAGIGFSN